MKKIILFIPFLFVFLLSGCGTLSEEAKIKADIKNYVTQSNELTKENAKATKMYNEKAVNGKDWAKIHDDIKNNLIPEYEKVLQQAKNVKIETEQVKSVHSFYIQAVELHLQNLKDSIMDIEKNDRKLLEETNKKMLTVKDLYAKRDASFKELVKKYNLNISIAPAPE